MLGRREMYTTSPSAMSRGHLTIVYMSQLLQGVLAHKD